MSSDPSRLSPDGGVLPPLWLTDLDGVLRAMSAAIPNVWPRRCWRTVLSSRSGPLPPEFDEDLVLTVASPVLDFVRLVHTTGAARIYWHTSWQHHAPKVFAPAVGLPALPVIDAEPEFTMHRNRAAPDVGPHEPEWWKIGAVHRIAASGVRMIWTDDELEHRSTRPSNTRLRDIAAMDNTLLVSPYEPSGLSPAGLNVIADFLGVEWGSAGDSPVGETAIDQISARGARGGHDHPGARAKGSS